MSERRARFAVPSGDALEAIASVAWTLEPPMPHERKHVLRSEAGILLDGLLVRCARGGGALDIAIGEGLAALGVGDRAMDLGHSGIGDYAREELGIPASTAQKMARLATALRDRPKLREAVWNGDVSARKAEIVVPVARGDDEAAWVARARAETVHALQAAIGAREAPDEPWDRVCIPVPEEAQPVSDQAFAFARKILGATAPRWQQIQVICEEFLGSHATDEKDDPDAILHAPVMEWLEPVKEWLEVQTAEWSFLERVDPIASPAGTETDALRLDAELRRLAGVRARWDEVFGHLAMLFRMLGLWRDAQFASFGHYCAERLGMGERTVEQRIWLERRLHELPPLRRAMREGRVSYEKARVIASHADDRTLDQLIATAESMTCIALKRKLEGEEEERQICARREIDLRVPRSVAALLSAAISAARKAAGRWIPAGECFRRIAQHFVDTWAPALKERTTLQKRALARDHGYCQKDGCSRAAVHAHHIDYRSAGGKDELPNLTGLCVAHHLRGVHTGRIRVHGQAPDRLQWELGSGSRHRRNTS